MFDGSGVGVCTGAVVTGGLVGVGCVGVIGVIDVPLVESGMRRTISRDNGPKKPVGDTPYAI